MYKTETIQGFIKKENGELKLNYDDIFNFLRLINFMTQEAKTGEEKEYVYGELQELIRIGIFNK